MQPVQIELSAAVAIGFTIFGIYSTFLWRLTSMMKAGDKETLVAMESADKATIARLDKMAALAEERTRAVHERMNHFQDNYVRKDDLDGHLKRIDERLSEMRNDMKEHNARADHRLDAILTAINGKPLAPG